MGDSMTSTTSAVTTTGNSGQTTLIIVVCIGGFIITASIIIIIVVAIFVRKSTRELRQRTKSDHNRPHGPRPAHASSIRMNQGQRVEVIRAQTEGQSDSNLEQKDVERKEGTQEEIQGYYAVIPRSEDLTGNPDGLEESAEKAIVYAALDFDDYAGKQSEHTGSKRLTGPSIVVPSRQPDTYVEMEPLVAVRKDSVPVQPYPAVYALAKNPDLEVHDPSQGISGGQTSTGVDNQMEVGPNGEVLIRPVVPLL